ncbi:pyridoxamine 5'-phosphate oxidase family protein [Kocuria marina]|uniref:Nitroimidazol reductase NimA, pyridoxamine 5'-phosphate oxidase superfamily n=1 Tax=Kocuria marina subsp. indica TaxID=1049583 RepID=A0A1X7D6T2_9MICC|nr:pyridoxamine 5'-phosphate oxidase family protein [Kocuria indica]OXS83013.1 flavin-nucleotide-binding protein [Kocuria indica]RLP57836.1 pyridoxamine 5'-phosphate oxidase family protein [Kocuria indica]SMF09931.1 Nitroimidazol reductase NimA, pyridoxamine 5'-phosphate oxidase superfamily [Kocuria indica]
MTDKDTSEIEELPPHTCWDLLRGAGLGRLAVWVGDHPDIFPINYAVDHGTLVFRSGQGTKVSHALSEVPVAVEIDGYDAPTAKAWSVVVRGQAEQVRQLQDLVDTVDLPLLPWQAGQKGIFVRIVPDLVTGRRFPVADPGIWQTPLSQAPRSPME